MSSLRVALVLPAVFVLSCTLDNPYFDEDTDTAAEGSESTTKDEPEPETTDEPEPETTEEPEPETTEEPESGEESEATEEGTSEVGDGDGDPLPECDVDQLLCGEECIDPDWDVVHCGMCDNPCAEPVEECLEGACLPIDRRVFVTSEAYPGNLGGIEGANAICQEHADFAELDGTFWAWLGAQGYSPAEEFGHHGRFLRMDGLVIAESWQDLVDGMLEYPVELNEFNEYTSFDTGYTCIPEGGPAAWTAVNISGGSMLGNCDNWTYGEGGDQGRTGFLNRKNELWTRVDGCTFQCGIALPIYCIEQ